MPSKKDGSGSEVVLTAVVLLAGIGGIMFFMTAEAMQWLSTWVNIGGIACSVGVLVGGGLWANRRDRRASEEKET